MDKSVHKTQSITANKNRTTKEKQSNQYGHSILEEKEDQEEEETTINAPTKDTKHDKDKDNRKCKVDEIKDDALDKLIAKHTNNIKEEERLLRSTKN